MPPFRSDSCGRSVDCCIESVVIDTAIADFDGMDTRIQTSFGTRCKELRAGLGVSQESFANAIGMDRSYYASIEAGRRNVTLINMKKLADGFGVSLSQLFDADVFDLTAI